MKKKAMTEYLLLTHTSAWHPRRMKGGGGAPGPSSMAAGTVCHVPSPPPEPATSGGAGWDGEELIGFGAPQAMHPDPLEETPRLPGRRVNPRPVPPPPATTEPAAAPVGASPPEAGVRSRSVPPSEGTPPRENAHCHRAESNTLALHVLVVPRRMVVETTPKTSTHPSLRDH